MSVKIDIPFRLEMGIRFEILRAINNLKVARFNQLQREIDTNREGEHHRTKNKNLLNKKGTVKKISPKSLSFWLVDLVKDGQLQHENGIYKKGAEFKQGLAMAELLWVLTQIEGRIVLVYRRGAPRKRFTDLPVDIQFIDKYGLERLENLMKEGLKWIERYNRASKLL